MQKDDIELASKIFGKDEFEYLCKLHIGMDAYKLLCVKYEKMQNSFYKERNYNNVDIFSVGLLEEIYIKDFENQENLFLGNFIAKIYVDFILHTKNIKLIKKNEKLLNQYLLQEEMYEDLIFLQNILK
jgi:hypothetical protein